MKVDTQLKKIESMYSENLKKTGVDSRSVGWNTEACQKLRFSKLAAVLDCSGPFSVNDLGCGYGALLEFLQQDLGAKVSKYYGYDISQDMLTLARARLASAECDVVELLQAPSLVTRADYAFVSGTFNVKFDAEPEVWKEYISSCLKNLDEFSDRGFAFNLLTSYVDWEEPHLFYGNPGYWFDYCKKNFSKRVSLLHDYDLWEWTIVVKK
ncbi:class I SAM-dependent methyltransferase [Ectopseudomonas khazarica]|uniref:class I SAM-dependent methyltransferase n=1 Tax=Ectopseudomonas khazarica TaxID=2502979 RepID=UPI00106DFF78|nr:class I SAM-dependent methyltransferase [Pseudomonas khazarica]